jgi:uncharacterized delta-60 repeat protein
MLHSFKAFAKQSINRPTRSQRPRESAKMAARRTFLASEQLETRRLLDGLGVLDPTFGQSGVAITDTLGKSTDRAYGATVTQPDGKILVAGTEIQPFIGGEMIVARYNADGSLDASFGMGGFTKTAFSVPEVGPDALALGPDGTVVVAAETYGNGSDHLAVARFLNNGTLDPSFGTGGEQLIPFSGQPPIDSFGMVVDGSGNTTVVADSTAYGPTEIELARFTKSGSLDSSFGSGGFATLSPSSATTSDGQAIALDGNGELIVAGSVNHQPAVLKFHSNGSLDASFGSNGIALMTSLPANGVFTSVATSSGGAIIAGGEEIVPGMPHMVVGRYNADGTVDTTFGQSGSVSTDIGSTSSFGTSVITDSQGRIVVVGGAYYLATNVDMAAARYNADGSLDTTFGSGGITTLDVSHGVDVAYGVAVSPTGNLVLAGSSWQSNIYNIALAQLTSNGMLDPGFGNDGQVLTDFSTSTSGDARAMAIQPDGKIVVIGSNYPVTGREFAVLRYNADGTLDKAFGENGLTSTPFTVPNPYDSAHPSVADSNAEGVAVDAQGRIVVAGFVYNPFGGSDFALARYLPDGALDTSFGTGGQELFAINAGGTNKAFAVRSDQNGKIVIAGYTALPQSNAGEDIAVLRFNDDGSLDRTFNLTGWVTTDFFGRNDEAQALAIQSDGKIVVGGSASYATAPSDFAVVRYNADGSLDATFGNAGKATTDFGHTADTANGMTLDPQGRIILAGASARGYPTYHDFAVARFTSQGALDTSFGTGGEVLTDFNGANDYAGPVTVNKDGKIIVAGQAYNQATGFDFAIAVYNDDGTLDTSIGSGGKITTDVTHAGNRDQIYGIALDGQQRLVVAGSTFRPATSYDFGLARYIIDAPPSASVFGVSVGVPGQPLSFSLGAMDDVADMASGFAYTVDWGDGSSPLEIAASANNGSGVVLNHIYKATGSYTVTITATNDDGIVSAPATLPVHIQTATLEPDPADGTKTALYVGGTLGNDRIDFRQDEVSGQIYVDYNGAVLGPFSPTGRLIAYGQGGDDVLDVSRSISLPAWLFGGDGNDVLRGGGGNNVLIGGAGHNLLLAGPGRDLLAAGGDSSMVVGGSGSDILIGGDLLFADLNAALAAIMREWTSANTFATRVASINGGGGMNGDYVLSLAKGTVALSQAGDLLLGGGGENWFFYDPSHDLIAGHIAAVNDQGPLPTFGNAEKLNRAAANGGDGGISSPGIASDGRDRIGL